MSLSGDADNFKVGCNDDLLSTTSTLTEDDGTVAREKQRAARNWMLQQARETKSAMATVCTIDHKLKRLPLPVQIKWLGEPGKQLEEFLSQFKGHTAQQDKSGYILHPELYCLWVKTGDPHTVLLRGLQQDLHVHLHFITIHQFRNDIIWVFGALQGALKSRGKLIVKEHM